MYLKKKKSKPDFLCDLTNNKPKYHAQIYTNKHTKNIHTHSLANSKLIKINIEIFALNWHVQ